MAMKSKDAEKLTAIRLEIIRLMNEYNRLAQSVDLGAKLSLMETSDDSYEDEEEAPEEEEWYSSQSCEWYSSDYCSF